MRVADLGRSRAARVAAAAPVVSLGVALLAPTLDLLALVQHEQPLSSLANGCCGLATMGLAARWLRRPRTAWLAAAFLAFSASTVLRLVGAAEAPALSLLGIVALGSGGAFAGPFASPKELSDGSSAAAGLVAGPLTEDGGGTPA